jgi:predicted AlkP superfamily pyrophosphatase or phosphodiesterase
LRHLAVGLLLLLGPAGAAHPAGPAAVSVVLVSIDGLRPDYVFEADRYGLKIPNLRRLLAEGAHARVTGVLPTVTYPSHTTLVTGAWPARHGILANVVFDPLRENQSGWYWYAEDIRVPTLWDAAAATGLVTASVDWPATVGARITHNIVQYWRTRGADAPDDAKLKRVLSTPGLLAEAERALGPYPAGDAYTVQEDRRRAAFNVYLLETRRPRLHFAYFSGLDEEQHESGPGSAKALAVLEEIDPLLGEVRAAAEKSGGGRAVIAVVSDHGHNRTDRELRLNEALRARGLILLDEKGKPTAWTAYAWNNGGSAAIILRDPGDAAARKTVEDVLAQLSALPDSPIQRVLAGPAARPAGGFPDAAFVVAAKPGVRIDGRMEGDVLQAGLPHGTHGFLPENPEMDATFLLAGPGIPRGRDLGRVDMRDVAPTLAALLGLKLPAAEGKNVIVRE